MAATFCQLVYDLQSWIAREYASDGNVVPSWGIALIEMIRAPGQKPTAPQPFTGAAPTKAIRVPCRPSQVAFAAVPGPPSSARRFTIGPSGESAGVSGVMSTPESTRHTAAGFSGGSR